MSAPWRDREQLAPLLAAWVDHVRNRPLYRVGTGPGWVTVAIAGERRDAFFLGALPGAVLAFPFTAPLPAPLGEDLRPTRGDPLPDLLREASLQDVGLLTEDLVLEFDLVTAAGPRRLRAQLFGQRGGIVVIDAAGRMLWTAHAGPHPGLVDPDARRAPARADEAGLEAWTETGLHRLARQREAVLGDRLRRTLGRRQAAAARLAGNLVEDLERADGGEQRRREAEALAACLHEVRRGASTVTVADPRGGPPLRIALDPGLAPHENLDRLFHQARKGERGREVIAERLAAARQEQQRVATAVAVLAPLLTGPPTEMEDELPSITLARLRALRDFAAAHEELLSERGPGPGRAPEEPARPFRRYRIDDRWEVWVGRSSEENDELTHRASHPQDLWLHAQGVGGSHVVLRTGGRPDTVPRPVLEKAAALAALHSKARHSSLVPVIWTERRYVRRPRKSVPGTAVCLREDNLFVEPGVMPGVEPA
jgi:hypothetical protein